MAHVTRAPLAFIVFALLCAGAATAQDRPTDLPEYTVKAGFLFNFAKYVDWPDSAFDAPDAPFRIGVVGEDPFGTRLETALKGRTVKDRKFMIERYPTAETLSPCHILFVTRTEQPRLGDILERVKDWPTLTVGEDGSFARSGGMISVLIKEEHPKLEVNAEAAKGARLTIDAKLLRLADLVRTER
jgi:hypothetical protein